jgi:hypothetical protein
MEAPVELQRQVAEVALEADLSGISRLRTPLLGVVTTADRANS